MRTTERLLQSHGGSGWAGGQDLRCVNQQLQGQKLASISPFQELLSGVLSLCCFQQIYKNNPIRFQQVSKVFPTKSQVPEHKFCKNDPH